MAGEESPLPLPFDVVMERDDEGYYVASVPQLPGCHTQARSLDELNQRIREAVELCLEVAGTPEQTLDPPVSSASQLRHEPDSAPYWLRVTGNPSPGWALP